MKQKMEPLSLKPRDKEGTDRNFEGAGVSSKAEQDIIRKAKLFNQIYDGESVVTPSNKTNHIDIVDHDQIDDSVETNMLDTFLETLVVEMMLHQRRKHLHCWKQIVE